MKKLTNSFMASSRVSINHYQIPGMNFVFESIDSGVLAEKFFSSTEIEDSVESIKALHAAVTKLPVAHYETLKLCMRHLQRYVPSLCSDLPKTVLNIRM